MNNYRRAELLNESHGLPLQTPLEPKTHVHKHSKYVLNI
jgi:hypothetical protein